MPVSPQVRKFRVDNGFCRDCGGSWLLMGRVICKACFDKRRAQEKRRHTARALTGNCITCGQEAKPTSKLCVFCTTRQVDRMRCVRRENKITVLNHFGGKCADCGISDYRVLTLDHINGNGRSECAGPKRRITTQEWYARLITRITKNEPIDGLQILCFNCHAIKDLFDDA